MNGGQRHLILSRKGFDSASGGGPSPILPDGRLLSLPIPETVGMGAGAIPYGGLRAGHGLTHGAVMEQLSVAFDVRRRPPHRDPDLDARLVARSPGWRPLFGQSGAAQQHLSRAGVTVGDLFLFFGLFRRAELSDGRLRWRPGAPRQHIVFGYLEIGGIIAVDATAADGGAPAWAADHPHVADPLRPHNTLYVATEQLSWNPELAGAGVLDEHSGLTLTAPDARGPSQWWLPEAFSPAGGGGLTYHGQPSRWGEADDGRVGLSSVGRGQEFVAPMTAPLQAWAADLIDRGSGLAT